MCVPLVLLLGVVDRQASWTVVIGIGKLERRYFCQIKNRSEGRREMEQRDE
jgi:hypothetical protein